MIRISKQFLNLKSSKAAETTCWDVFLQNFTLTISKAPFPPFEPTVLFWSAMPLEVKPLLKHSWFPKNHTKTELEASPTESQGSHTGTIPKVPFKDTLESICRPSRPTLHLHMQVFSFLFFSCCTFLITLVSSPEKTNKVVSIFRDGRKRWGFFVYISGNYTIYMDTGFTQYSKCVEYRIFLIFYWRWNCVFSVSGTHLVVDRVFLCILSSERRKGVDILGFFCLFFVIVFFSFVFVILDVDKL